MLNPNSYVVTQAKTNRVSKLIRLGTLEPLTWNLATSWNVWWNFGTYWILYLEPFLRTWEMFETFTWNPHLEPRNLPEPWLATPSWLELSPKKLLLGNLEPPGSFTWNSYLEPWNLARWLGPKAFRSFSCWGKNPQVSPALSLGLTSPGCAWEPPSPWEAPGHALAAANWGSGSGHPRNREAPVAVLVYLFTSLLPNRLFWGGCLLVFFWPSTIYSKSASLSRDWKHLKYFCWLSEVKKLLCSVNKKSFLSKGT